MKQRQRSLMAVLGGGVPVSTTFIAAGGWFVCKCTPLQIARLPVAGLDPFRLPRRR